jgi:hypothetical protein
MINKKLHKYGRQFYRCSFCRSGTRRFIRKYRMDICGQCFALNALDFGWKLGRSA